MASGAVDVLVIGGGVEQASRDLLGQAAASGGTTVLDGGLAGRDLETYVREELEPRLVPAPRSPS